MRFYRAAILAAGLAVVCSSSAHAGYHHVVAPAVSKSVGAGGGSSSGNWHLCPTPAGIFICAVTVAIVVHEVLGPACASNTPRNRKYGWDQPTLWRPLCDWKRDPVVRVRAAASAKLWPNGK